MYNQKLVASIKVKGKILREFKDTVYIPFSSEYSILLKNLHTQRAVVNVYLDGENVVPGGLVIDPGRSIDLERWIKNGNLSEGNKFKFIERTGSVEAHRGIGIEDGLVRIEYQFELPAIQPNWNSIMRGIDKGWITASGATYSSTSASLNNIQCSTNTSNVSNDVGITVPGSHSTQSFSTTYVGALDPTKHNLVFKLVGGTMPKPITVKHKPKCVTCGKQNKATSKFCQECGTALEIFA